MSEHDKPFGGLSPQEAARRSHEVQRQRAAEREADQEFERLTVAGRVTTAMASELSLTRMRSALDVQLQKAEKGDQKALSEIRQWVKLGLELEASGDAVPEGQEWEDLEPGQRAALRAQLREWMAQTGVDPRGDEQPPKAGEVPR